MIEERPHTRTAAIDERPDTREEIDLARYGRRVARRWWIVALCVAVAVAVALLRQEAGSGAAVSEGRALVSIGQPLSPTGTLIPGTVASNPLIASTLLNQRAVQDTAAAEAGLRPGSLVGRVSTQVAGGTAAGRTGSGLLMNVIVRGPFEPAEAAAAANALAEALRAETSRFQAAKQRRLEEDIARLERRGRQLERDTQDARVRLQRLTAERGLTGIERLVAQNNLTAAVQYNSTAAEQVQEDLSSRRILLETSRQVEQSRILAAARGSRVDRASSRSGVVVAALLGLILGVLLALASYLVRPGRA